MRSDEEKRRRQQALQETIEENRVGTQMDLMNALMQKGFEVTQTTISRDLLELGVMKVSGEYRMPSGAMIPIWVKTLEVEGRAVEAVGENLLVVKTAAGAAQIVARSIEAENWKEIAGVVAGDDTLFIAVRSAGELKHLVQRLSKAIKIT